MSVLVLFWFGPWDFALGLEAMCHPWGLGICGP